jgi:hypothetical protein
MQQCIRYISIITVITDIYLCYKSYRVFGMLDVALMMKNYVILLCAQDLTVIL